MEYNVQKFSINMLYTWNEYCKSIYTPIRKKEKNGKTSHKQKKKPKTETSKWI